MSLRIWHTADLHDCRGIAAPLHALRAAEPGFLFDCGDALRGSQTVYRRAEPIVAEMDAAGYDAQALGNREFHYLFGAVAARARNMRHPLVCANLIDLRGRALPFTPDVTLEHRAADALWSLRVFGLTVVQYGDRSAWEHVFGWRFLPPLDVARRIAAETPDSVMLVALSHLGLRTDRALARAVPRLDVILGGHSHDTLHAPDVVEGVPIVHAGPYGRFVSRTEWERDAGRPRLARYDLVPLRAAA